MYMYLKLYRWIKIITLLFLASPTLVQYHNVEGNSLTHMYMCMYAVVVPIIRNSCLYQHSILATCTYHNIYIWAVRGAYMYSSTVHVTFFLCLHNYFDTVHISCQHIEHNMCTLYIDVDDAVYNTI